MANTYRTENYIMDDRYEIIEGINRGANGELYRVTDLADDKEYYAKQLIVQKNLIHLSAAKIRDRIKDVKKNGPPVIVPVMNFEVIEHSQDFVIWIVTEISPLQTLAKYISFKIEDSDLITCERQSAASLQQIFNNLCDALEDLHNKTIIHGNLKPHNIFIHNDGRIQFSDINILNLSANVSDKDYQGYLSISKLWNAPESFHNKPLTESSDLFSLGVILYQMMSRKHPFQLINEDDIVDPIKKVTDQIKDYSFDYKEIPNIVNALKNILKKSLAKSPDKRYRTVQSLKKDLENVLFTKYCPVKHPNEYDAAECTQCQLRFDEASIVHDWNTIAKWISFVPVNDAIKRNQSKTLRLKIKPAFINERDDLIKLGKTSQLQLADKIDPLLIRLLPEPQIDIELKDRHILYDQTMEDTKINFQLSMLRSEAVIKKIDVSANGDTIDHSNINARSFLYQHITPDTSPYAFSVLLNMANITKGETVRFRFDIYIKNRGDKPIQIDEVSTGHSLSLPVIHPAQLKILYYKNPVQIFKKLDRLNQIFDVTNTGGEILRIVEIKAMGITGKDASNNKTENLLTNNAFEFQTFDIHDLLPGKRQSFPCRIFPQKFLQNNINKYLLDLNIVYKIFDAGKWQEKSKPCPLSITVSDTKHGYLLAVDFGTTNTLCAAVWNSKDISNINWNTPEKIKGNILHLETIASLNKSSVVPSAIELLFDNNEENKIIGEKAYSSYLIGEKNTFRSFKRRLGSNIFEDDPISLPDNDYKYVLSDKLTQDYLSLLKDKIEEITGYKFENYIFTHPSKLSIKKLNAFNRIIKKILPEDADYDFIDEATAGALFFIQQKLQAKQNGYRLIVYDFGGGTIDITYLLITRPHSKITVEILDVDGLPDYGGDNISEAIETIIVTQLKTDPEFNFIYKDNHWGEIYPDQAGSNKQRVWNYCEKIKPLFAAQPTFSDDLPLIYYYNEINDKVESKNAYIEFKVQDVYKMIYAKLDESVNCIASIIERTSQDIIDLPCYLYVSGQSSQIPLVKSIFDAYESCMRPFYDETTKKIEYNTVNTAWPMQFAETNFDDISSGRGFIKACVALGAAYYSANQLDDPDNQQIRVKGMGQKNRTRFGMKRPDGMKNQFVEWIPKNKSFVQEFRIPDLDDSNIRTGDACAIREYTFLFSNNKLKNTISIYEHMGQGNDYSEKNCELIGQFTFNQPTGVDNKEKGRLLLIMSDQYEAVVKVNIQDQWIMANKYEN